MSARRRGGYPYSLNEPPAHPGQPKKKRIPGRYIVLPMLLVLLFGGIYFVFSSPSSGSSKLFSPFPKELLALRFLHNGQELVLKRDTQCVVNPRDTLQLLEVQTDGWISWGTKVVATDLDPRAFRKGQLEIKGLLPQENFETPKLIEMRVLVWNKPIGQVSFLIQLDAKDWLEKANSTSDAERKIFYMEKSLHENPGNILVKTQLAGLYFDTQRYDDAGRLYKEINESGKSKSVLERLLSVYQHQRKINDALMTYLDLLRLGEEPEVFKEFLQYLQKHVSRDEGGRFLEKHQQEFPKAFQSSLHLFMADLNSQSKHWSKAAAAYEKAIREGAKDSDVLYNLAVTYQQSDDPDKAVQALERYLQKNPSDIKSWMQLGALQEKKGAHAQARTTYETVLQKNPQNRDALLRLVAIMEKNRDKAGLQGAYEKLAQMQPKNRTVQYNLGVLYYEAKKYDKAAGCFETIASMDQKDLESRKYLLDIYRKQKNEKGELSVLQNLAQLDPKNTSYYDGLFKGLDEKKDYKGMVSMFRPAAEQHPDSVTFHNYLLYALLKTGDSKGALKELEQLIRLQPKEKKHLRQAANLYESSGDYASALKKLDQLLKLDPKDKEAKDDYLRLKMLALSKKKST